MKSVTINNIDVNGKLTPVATYGDEKSDVNIIKSFTEYDEEIVTIHIIIYTDDDANIRALVCRPY